MGRQDHQRILLRKYLLVELPQTDRSQLADRYFADEKLFEELLDVENELLDQYACGQLSPDETKKFRDYLTSLPDVQTKLATAYVLNKARKQEALAVKGPVLLSRWEVLRGLLFGRAPLPHYVTAAIVAALVCGLAYLIISQRAMRRQIEQLRVEQTQAEQERVNSAQQVQIAQENEAALRDRNLQLERELRQLREQPNTQKENGNGPALALLILTPALRSGTPPDSLTISSATKTILLVMPIPKGEQITDYSAVLRTTKGELILTKNRLRSERSDQGAKTVSFSLSAARLTPRTYKLTLHGKGADGVEIAQDFYFNVVRR